MKITEAAAVIEAEAIQRLKAIIRKTPLTIAEIAASLGTSTSQAQRIIKELRATGAMIHDAHGGRFGLADSITLPKGTASFKGKRGEWQHEFLFVTDNHLCNKHSRLDVLQKAFAHAKSLGITKVLNAGNWIDGEARFNRTELITAPGMDNQLDYMIDNWPVVQGMKTYFIAGDDHEGWYQQREGIEVGRYLQVRAEHQGRHDLHYLGYGEADICLPFGSGSSVARVVHPGGGSAYAISYTDQKRVESYQGGEKPQIEFVGHYHKFNHGYPREVHTFQGGCTCDQTMFMRKKRLQAHVGYSIIRIAQGPQGEVTRVSCEWFPSYDRGFYEHRF